MSSLKAEITICDDKGNETDSMYVTFNPSNYRITSTPHYKDMRHLEHDEARKQFVGGVTRTFSTTLIFDSFSDEDLFPEDKAKKVTNITDGILTDLRPITDKLKRLEAAAHVVGEQHKPPLVKFSWGNLNFVGIISDMSVDYTMFSIEGKPIRATVSLTMAEVQDPKLTKMKSPFESPDRTKSKVVVEGMSLWSIAWDEYDDCEKWRIIAKANNIMNPMDVRPGQVIRIPALDRE